MDRATVERIWHVYDSQGQILALALRQKSFKVLEMYPLRSEALRPYLAESVHTFVLQNSIPAAQIRRCILYYYLFKE